MANVRGALGIAAIVAVILGAGALETIRRRMEMKSEEAKAKAAKIPKFIAQEIAWEEPTDEQAMELARVVERAFAERAPELMVERLEIDQLLLKSMRNLPISPRGRDAAAQWLKSAKPIHALFQQFPDDGSLNARCLRITRVREHKALVFRIVSSQGLGYQAWMIGIAPGGFEARLLDWYDYGKGDWASTFFRQGLLPVVASENRDFWQKLRGEDSDFIKHSKEIDAFANSVRQQRHARALEQYDALPRQVQQHKLVQFLRLRAASCVGGPRYLQALKDLRAAYPDDAGVELLSMDFHAMREEYAEARACVRKLAESVGGDPYLFVTEANLALFQREFADARRLAARALAEDPGLQDAHFALVKAAACEGDFAGAAEALATFAASFDLNWEVIESDLYLAEFVASDEYAAFHARPAP